MPDSAAAIIILPTEERFSNVNDEATDPSDSFCTAPVIVPKPDNVPWFRMKLLVSVPPELTTTLALLFCHVCSAL